jgi:hypothetical protein
MNDRPILDYLVALARELHFVRAAASEKIETDAGSSTSEAEAAL